jgi:hypothetical protein
MPEGLGITTRRELFGPRRATMTWARGGALLLIVVAFVGIVASYGKFIPYWDARSYYNCVAVAVRKPFDIFNFTCVGHPSIVYLLLLGLTQYVAPWNVSFMYAVNAILGVASIIAFDALLRVLFPGRTATEYALVAALYALAPLFLAHAIFLNVDYGLTAFFVLFLYFLLARRFWTAAAAAVAMIFSKETGLAAFAVTVVAYLVAFTMRTPTSGKERLFEFRRLVPLFLAPIAVAMYIVAFQMFHPTTGSWAASYVPLAAIRDPVDLVLNMNLADAGMRSFLADIFVLNFQWLYAGVLVVAACAAVLRTAGSKEDRAVPGTGLFLCLVLSGLVYIVTRYRAYNNARYVLAVSPVLILAFYHALLSVLTRSAVRRSFLSLAVVLVFLSNFRTLDFVSKSVFGTFRFGSHELLDMPSLIGGLKQDSTVYNLESLQFNDLLNDMMQDLRPAPYTTFFMGDTTYNFPPPVDARSYALTVDPSYALPISFVSGDAEVTREALRKSGTREGDRLFYLAFANANNHQLRLLLQLYPLVETKRYDRHGYAIDVYTFAFTSPT